MHIVVTCPQCSRQLRLPRETLGRSVRCPLCQSIFLTRETEDGQAEALPMAQPSASAAPPPPPVNKPTVPNLSLDDDIPEAPLLRPAPPPPRPQPDEEEVLEPL